MPEIECEIELRRKMPGAYEAQLRLTPPRGNAILLASAVPVSLPIDGLLVATLDPDAYARTLTDALFAAEPLRDAWEKAYAYASGQESTLRCLLRLDATDGLLQSLRWETLLDPVRRTSMALSTLVRFSRTLDSGSLQLLRPQADGPLTALVAIANPVDLSEYGLSPIDESGEFRRCELALGGVNLRRLTRTGGGSGLTLASLDQALRERPAILYLVCHGSYLDGEPYLWLERDDGSSHRVVVTTFAAMLARIEQLPALIFIGACTSAGPGHQEGVLAAVGPSCVAAGAAAVVAMQGPIAISTLANFVPTFFRELFVDGVVDRAVAVARAGIASQADWWAPVLFLRLRNGRLFERELLPKPACPYPGLLPFRQAQAQRFPFYGRGAEVDELLRKLLGHRRVLIVGPSGAGKSSLLEVGLAPRLAAGLHGGRRWLEK